MKLFSHFRRHPSKGKDARPPAPDLAAELGAGLFAARLGEGQQAPAGSVLVVFSEGGQARRSGPRGARETAFCFHPGPYSIDLTPFAAAPELGLRMRFVADAGDPRVAQQRFDLYLFSEAGQVLSVAAFGAAVESAVQDALEQGTLALPPCTSLDEWNAFRTGVNQLLYTRFGVTVEDCIPVDLGESVNFAAVLRGRVQQAVEPEARPTPEAAGASTPIDARDEQRTGEHRPDSAPSTAIAASAADDAHALRRLFLELPALAGGLRLIALPPGQPLFLAHQSLLQRLALLALDVNTMPSLAWAAPGQALAPARQARRAHGSVLAVQALDQAWALLARLQTGAAPRSGLPELFDEADRLLSNLDLYLSRRRAVQAPQSGAGKPPPDGPRREPSL